MNHYKIAIAYDGTLYKGWQRLVNDTSTIQQILEEKIEYIIGEKVNLNASGRTDAGVHAHNQIADFFCKKNLDDSFIKSINCELPSDIKIHSLENVADNFHSRKSAISKTYSYHISLCEKPNVFKRKYCYYPADAPINLSISKISPENINFASIKQAIDILIGTHDFSAFTTDKSEKSHVRTIEKIEYTLNKDSNFQDEIVFTFTGSGFLYNMVRILSGTLLVIGLNGTNCLKSPQFKEITADNLINILASQKRSLAGPTLPPQGLFLENVKY